MAKIHTMIDIETLGFRPSTCILSVGAIKFDPYSNAEPGPGFYMKFDVDAQMALGRTTDESTLTWWGEQNETVRNEAMGDDGREPLDTCMDALHKFVWGSDIVWAQGPTFDMVILENLYAMKGKTVPWQFYQVRDSRTIFTMGVDPEMNKGNDAHNALADAYWQAKGVQNVYRKLGIKP